MKEKHFWTHLQSSIYIHSSSCTVRTFLAAVVVQESFSSPVLITTGSHLDHLSVLLSYNLFRSPKVALLQDIISEQQPYQTPHQQEHLNHKPIATIHPFIHRGPPNRNLHARRRLQLNRKPQPCVYKHFQNVVKTAYLIVATCKTCLVLKQHRSSRMLLAAIMWTLKLNEKKLICRNNEVQVHSHYHFLQLF